MVGLVASTIVNEVVQVGHLLKSLNRSIIVVVGLVHLLAVFDA